MPRTKPTKKLGVYGKYDLKLDQAVETYEESKRQEKFFIQEPKWDVAREGIEAVAIRNERDHNDMLHLQDEMRRKLKTDEIVNDKRIRELYRMDEQLREQFISVNDFIRDCEDKKHNADEKITIETRCHEEINAEIKRIRESMATLSEFEKKLAATVEQFRPYEQVIEQVVAESDLYKNVKDMIDRCDALMIAQVEIAEMEEQKTKAIEEMRQKMVQATNEAALTVMGLNNELSELERCYNASQAETSKWARILMATKTCILDKELLSFRLLDQIQQLYGLLCARNGAERKFKREQVEEQLDYIKEEMEFMSDVLKMSHKMMADEKKAAAAVTPVGTSDAK